MQPDQPAEQPQPQPQGLRLQLTVDSGVAGGPDGKPWVVVLVAWALNEVRFLLPEDVAQSALEQGLFQQALEKGVRLAKTARGAAVQLATEQDLANLPKLMGPNGLPFPRAN